MCNFWSKEYPKSSNSFLDWLSNRKKFEVQEPYFPSWSAEQFDHSVFSDL